jgi:hypothetical protein
VAAAETTWAACPDSPARERFEESDQRIDILLAQVSG